MPPGQSGVLRLFGVGCEISFVQIIVDADAIDLAQGGSYTLDIPLPDIDIYANLSGFGANTPLAHFLVNMDNKKEEEQIHTLLAADATNVYRFFITINANNIPVLRMFVSTNAVAGLTIDFEHIWDIWITNCAPFSEIAAAPA